MSPLAALFAYAYPGATVERMSSPRERSLKSPRKSNVGASLPLCPELQPTSFPTECDRPALERCSSRASAAAACTPLLVAKSARRIFRIELDRLTAVTQSFIRLDLFDMGRATVSVGHRIVRIELDCLIAIVQCLINLALLDPRGAAANVARRIFRIELDRLIQVADGTVIIAPSGVPKPAAVESRRIFRIELDHLIQITEGPVIVTLGKVPSRAVVEGCRIFRIELDCLI